MKTCIFFLLFIFNCLGYTGYSQEVPQLGAFLQADISFDPISPTNTPGKIQPGSLVNLKALVKNRGPLASLSGEIFIRFILPHPLKSHAQSLLYESSKQPFPSIFPGEEVSINFSPPHRWPSIFDYVRDDWGMRYYEVVVNIKGQEIVIGAMSIAISAYYYEGLAEDKGVAVPSES